MALSKVSLKQTVTAAMSFQKFNIADSHFQVPTVVDRCRMMRDRWPPRVEIDGPLFFSETLLAGQASQRRQRASGDPGAEARGPASVFFRVRSCITNIFCKFLYGLKSLPKIGGEENKIGRYSNEIKIRFRWVGSIVRPQESICQTRMTRQIGRKKAARLFFNFLDLYIVDIERTRPFCLSSFPR